MTVEEVIEALLFGAVRDLDQFDAGHKAWPNVTFDPPAGEAYLRVDHFANGNERLFMKGSNPHRYLGILQLTVVAPLNLGPTVATRLAGTVAAEFRADLALYEFGLKVRIEKAPDIARAFPADATWNVVVSIRYECFAQQRPLVGMLDFSISESSQYIPLV